MVYNKSIKWSDIDCDNITFRKYAPLSVMTLEDAKIYEKERKQSEVRMDKKIKGAEKKIEKVEKKEFKGLLKEDHKLDKKRDNLEKEVAKKKK